MNLHRRLLWIHKNYAPEVFLRTLAVVQGQHGGGLRGSVRLVHVPFDLIAPDYAIGALDVVAGDDVKYNLQQQADAIARWLETGRGADPTVDGVPIRSSYHLAETLPVTAREGKYLDWIARIVKAAAKFRDRMHAGGGVVAPSYYYSEGRSGREYDPPYVQPDRFLWDSRDRIGKRAPRERFPNAPWGDIVTLADVTFAREMVLLAEHLGRILDWVEGNPGTDLNRIDLYTAINSQNEWHAELAAVAEREVARRNPGIVIKRWDDGWTAQSLTTTKELLGEGKAMGHCVGESGRYINGIRDGSIAILSIRDPAGDPHVTIELLLYDQDEEPLDEYIVEFDGGAGQQVLQFGHVVQAKGFNNRLAEHDVVPYMRDLLHDLDVDRNDWGEASIARRPKDVLIDVERASDFNRIMHEIYEYSFPQISKMSLLGLMDRAKESDRYEDLVRVYGALTVLSQGSGGSGFYRMREILNANMDGRLDAAILNESDWFDEIMADVTDFPSPSRLLGQRRREHGL